MKCLLLAASLLVLLGCGASQDGRVQSFHGPARRCTDEGCWTALDYVGCSDDPEETDLEYCHPPEHFDLLTQE